VKESTKEVVWNYSLAAFPIMLTLLSLLLYNFFFYQNYYETEKLKQQGIYEIEGTFHVFSMSMRRSLSR